MQYINKLFNLENKVAVLTGGGGVLACSMAEGLLQSGVTVILLDLDKDNLTCVLGSLYKQGTVRVKSCNVLVKADLEKVRDEILEEFGRIDILINCAGGNMAGATIGPDQTIFDVKMDDFQKVVDLNLNGSVLPSLVFGQVMANQSEGTIINMSSMAADRVITRVVGYSASKAAITNFTKWMSVELAQKFGDGIRVNAIAPGFFIGNQNKKLLLNDDGSYTDRGNTIINNTPMKRFGEAKELIGATLFLCSDSAKFITGVVLPVDGGFSAFSGV